MWHTSAVVAGSAALGAVLYAVISVVRGVQIDVLDLTISAAGAVVAGLLIEILIAIEQIRKSIEAIPSKQMSELSGFFRDQDLFKPPFDLLQRGRKHGSTLYALLAGSINDNCQAVPNVDRNRYRAFLISAISDADSYLGVKHGTIKSFAKERDGDRSVITYLNALKSKEMGGKTRIFVVKDADRASMEKELKDPEIFREYWELTGEDVQTYWTTRKDLKESGSNIPNDCAIYDRELCFVYDDRRHTLTFDLLDDEVSPARGGILDFFDRLDDQEKIAGSAPFRKIKPARIYGS